MAWNQGAWFLLAPFFFLSIALAVQGLQCLHINFKILFWFCDWHHWWLDRDCIDSVDCLGSYDHFDSIDSLNPRTWYIFSSVSSLISFIIVLQLLECRLFVSLDKFIPWCLILFDTKVNEIVSVISHLTLLLLMY